MQRMGHINQQRNGRGVQATCPQAAHRPDPLPWRIQADARVNPPVTGIGMPALRMRRRKPLRGLCAFRAQSIGRTENVTPGIRIIITVTERTVAALSSVLCTGAATAPP